MKYGSVNIKKMNFNQKTQHFKRVCGIKTITLNAKARDWDGHNVNNGFKSV